jgi:hypothetical protein
VKRVQVEWIDSVTDGGWISRDEAVNRAATPDVLACTSVGLLVANEDGYLLLATSHMRDGDLVQGCLQIPKDTIRDIWELRR